METTARLDSPDPEFDEEDWDEEEDELPGTDEEELELDEYDELDEDADV